MVYYCTSQDIETQISIPTLIQLSSDTGQDAIDQTVVEEAILYASTLIDGYLRGRYTLPLNTHFPLLRILCIDISIYRLYCRRLYTEIPEAISEAYKNAIATLRDIQKGILSLQAESETNETSTFSPSEYRTNKDILEDRKSVV